MNATEQVALIIRLFDEAFANRYNPEFLAEGIKAFDEAVETLDDPTGVWKPIVKSLSDKLRLISDKFDL